MGLLSDQALGKSPFDLPKTYNYESFTDYHINKSEQLLHIKNYDLAIKEFRGLYDCAVNNEILDISSNFKEKFFIAEESLIIRDKFRNKLIDFYRNENISLDYNLAKSYLLGFKDSSKETEEYYQLIEKIISSNLINNEKNINLLEHTYQVILSFDPLKYIIEMGRISLKNGEKPFMLFDSDSTLFDNSPRVHKIIQDFISDHKDIYPKEIKKLNLIQREDIVWGIKENLARKGLIDDELVKKIALYWYERFFSNEYVIDVPLKGATYFIKEVKDAGINVVYLTGRFESMREGTARNILEHGFPLDDFENKLILKPSEKISDESFKHTAMGDIKKMGTMIAGFENEPVNANIFQDHCPDSEIFFLETNHSMNPPNLTNTVHTIRNFEFNSPNRVHENKHFV